MLLHRQNREAPQCRIIGDVVDFASGEHELDLVRDVLHPLEESLVDARLRRLISQIMEVGLAVFAELHVEAQEEDALRSQDQSQVDRQSAGAPNPDQLLRSKLPARRARHRVKPWRWVVVELVVASATHDHAVISSGSFLPDLPPPIEITEDRDLHDPSTQRERRVAAYGSFASEPLPVEIPKGRASANDVDFLSLPDSTGSPLPGHLS